VIDVHRRQFFVIASEAKQSMAGKGRADCFASLAMTIAHITVGLIDSPSNRYKT
jgi:hypothetical protein